MKTVSIFHVVLQVKMMDKDSGEQLVFYIDRWLALGQDDGNICREIPVVRKGIPNIAGNFIIIP